MKALAATLLVMGLVALAASPGIASAVSFTLNYSDPDSDVVKLWTSNGTPVLTSGGDLTMSPFPASVNIRWARSANASANVSLTIEVQGNIANLDNTSYEIRLFTRADNASHFIVTYVNGATHLTSNATGFGTVDISGNSTITSAGGNPTLQNALRINVAKSLLDPITAWNIDAIATQVDASNTYTYRDYGWQVPGNPGSAPTPPPNPSVLPSWIWIVIGVAIVAVLVAIVVAIRRRKPAPPEK